MDKTVIMRIENEFTLLDQTRDVCDGREHFRGLIEQLNGHYFRKSSSCVRLHTGGSFYIDQENPEITTTPFDLRKDGITALVENLFMQTGVILEALHHYNQHLKRKSLPFRYPPYCLQGYSAHYSFTFPVIPPYRAEVTKLLAETVNPVVQLFLENRQSRGVMYRYVDGRSECDRKFYSPRRVRHGLERSFI